MILILFVGLRRQTLRGFFDKLRGEGEILLLFFVQSWKVWWKIFFSVRSKMFSRSNSASAPNTVSMKRPWGVVVSMFSFRLTNSTPFLPTMPTASILRWYSGSCNTAVQPPPSDTSALSRNELSKQFKIMHS